MLQQALRLQTLIIIFDGIDEAADRRYYMTRLLCDVLTRLLPIHALPRAALQGIQTCPWGG